MIIANELTLWQVTLLGLFFVFNCCRFCPLLIDDEVVKVKTGERRRRQYVFASSQKDKY